MGRLDAWTANHLVRKIGRLRQWPRFPQGALAIAENGSGDLLVLLRDGSDVALGLFTHAPDRARLLALGRFGIAGLVVGVLEWIAFSGGDTRD